MMNRSIEHSRVYGKQADCMCCSALKIPFLSPEKQPANAGILQRMASMSLFQMHEVSSLNVIQTYVSILLLLVACSCFFPNQCKLWLCAAT